MGASRDAASLIEQGMPGQVPAARRPSSLLALLRIAVGLAALGAGVRLALGHQATAEHAAGWAVPAPTVAVLACAVALVVFGLMLLLGLASRLCALVLLAVALAIVATAGRVEGGLPLIGGALLAAACLPIVARGGGPGALLDRIDPPDAW